MIFFVGGNWGVFFCGSGGGRGIRAEAIRVGREIVRSGWNRGMVRGWCGGLVEDVVSGIGRLRA